LLPEIGQATFSGPNVAECRASRQRKRPLPVRPHFADSFWRGPGRCDPLPETPSDWT